MDYITQVTLSIIINQNSFYCFLFSINFIRELENVSEIDVSLPFYLLFMKKVALKVCKLFDEKLEKKSFSNPRERAKRQNAI